MRPHNSRSERATPCPALRARGAACGAPSRRHPPGRERSDERVWRSVFLFHLSVLRPGRGRVGQVPSPHPSRRHERVSCASVSCILRPAKRWITGPDGGTAGGASGGPRCSFCARAKGCRPRASVRSARCRPAAHGSRACGSFSGAPLGPWVLVFRTRRCRLSLLPPHPQRSLKPRSSAAFSLNPARPAFCRCHRGGRAGEALLKDTPSGPALASNTPCS